MHTFNKAFASENPRASGTRLRPGVPANATSTGWNPTVKAHAGKSRLLSEACQDETVDAPSALYGSRSARPFRARRLARTWDLQRKPTKVLCARAVLGEGCSGVP